MRHQTRTKCPNCPPEKGASLSINTQSGLYHCFRCGLSGRLRNGSPASLHHLQNEVFNRVDFLPWPDTYKKIDPYKPESILEKVALRYLQNRNVTPDQILDFQIGYTTEGPYRDRIIVPVLKGDELLYYVARSIRPLEKRKYLNPPKPKGGIIFKTFQGIAPMSLVVEGVFDAIRTANVLPSIALFSKHATKAQLESVASSTSHAIIMLDGDAVREATELTKELGYHVYCSVIPIKEKDPGSLSIERIQEYVRKVHP